MTRRVAVNVEDVRQEARRRLPAAVFDIVDGGAGDERTLQANTAAFSRVGLRPRALADVATRDLATTVLGERVSMPVLLAPCGTARILHPQGELAVAKAAGALGTVYTLSTVSSYPLEDVASAATGPLWYQLYPPQDRTVRRELVGRAKAAGYRALCVTVDGAVIGSRERDRRNGLSVPFRVTPRLAMQGAAHPRWAWGFLRSGPRGGLLGRTRSAVPSTIDETGRAMMSTATPVTREMVAELRALWDGPLVLKGITRGDDVAALLDLGVDGLIVSNHGGRQLDTVRPSLEILPEVVEAVAGRCEVLLDGGVRRGTDVLKALALGASAVLIGRPYLFGLAAGGQRGVEDVLRLLFSEFDTAMALSGCRNVSDVGSDVLAGAGTSMTGERTGLSEVTVG